MPELPDVTVYLEALDREVVGQAPRARALASPFLLRSLRPAARRVHGRTVARRAAHRQAHRARARRRPLPRHAPDDRRAACAGARPGQKPGMGAKIAPGRLRLRRRHALSSPRRARKKRASLHVVRGEAALGALDPGGIEPLEATRRGVPRRAHAREPHAQARAHRSAPLQRHRQRLLRRDPARGEAVADEADAARSPTTRSRGCTRRRARRCAKWIERLREEAGERLPGEGHRVPRRRWPCTAASSSPAPSAARRCSASSTPRTRRNYCARCQTGGKLLADRALSRLLKDDWPKSIDDL